MANPIHCPHCGRERAGGRSAQVALSVCSRAMRSLAALTLTACAASWSQAPDAARERFVRDFTCPSDRVVVVEQPPAPPDEVRGDPERLRLWNEQQHDPEHRYEHAEGCSHAALYNCWRFGRHSEVMLCEAMKP
jgi:hypothetical protein